MTRDEIYRRFGPKLLEAIVRMTLNEINILRSKAGLPERTVQQVIDSLENNLAQLDKYDWMED